MNNDAWGNPDSSPFSMTFNRISLVIMLANIVLGGRHRVTESDDARLALNIVFDGRKIALIKFIRCHLNVSLLEAKDLAENHILKTSPPNSVETAARAVFNEGTFNTIK